MGELCPHALYDLGESEAQKKLRRVVCNRYWWLAGDMFTIFGLLGWGPGHRDLTERDTPGLARLELNKLLYVLAVTKPVDEVEDVVISSLDVHDTSLEAQTVRQLLGVYEWEFSTKPIWHVYDLIANRGNLYQHGAAREFVNYYYDGADPSIVLAGLVLILLRELTPERVRQRKEELRKTGPLDWSFHKTLQQTQQQVVEVAAVAM